MWVGGGSGLSDACVTGVLRPVRPDTTSDTTCPSLQVAVSSAPAGVSLFSAAFCSNTAVLTGTHSLRANRFGPFAWTAQVTDARQTWSSANISYVARAALTLDAGTTRLEVGSCNPVQLFASGGLGRALANGSVPFELRASQGATDLPNCGAASFAAGQSTALTGVNPTELGDVTLFVLGSPVFPDGGAPITLQTCLGSGSVCGSSLHCCTASCVASQCQ